LTEDGAKLDEAVGKLGSFTDPDVGVAGNDQSYTLVGGAGDDVLIGGNKNDTLIGGEGNDVFVFELANTDNVQDTDVIKDLKPGDEIHLKDVVVDTTSAGDLSALLPAGEETTVVSGNQTVSVPGVSSDDLAVSVVETTTIIKIDDSSPTPM